VASWRTFAVRGDSSTDQFYDFNPTRHLTTQSPYSLNWSDFMTNIRRAWRIKCPIRHDFNQSISTTPESIEANSWRTFTRLWRLKCSIRQDFYPWRSSLVNKPLHDEHSPAWRIKCSIWRDFNHIQESIEVTSWRTFAVCGDYNDPFGRTFTLVLKKFGSHYATWQTFACVANQIFNSACSTLLKSLSHKPSRYLRPLASPYSINWIAVTCRIPKQS